MNKGDLRGKGANLWGEGLCPARFGLSDLPVPGHNGWHPGLVRGAGPWCRVRLPGLGVALDGAAATA